MRKRVAFKTLGCRLNQFETDALVTDFHKAGYEVVDYSDKADVYIVNTCTVTNQSDQKSRNTINQAVKSAGDSSLVVVTGCMANSQKEYLEGRGDLTYVVNNKQKSSIFPLVDSHFKGEILHPTYLKQDLFNFSVVEKGFHTRSMIKIQDGCNNFCTYCIVPKVRGRAISRPQKQILKNIKDVLEFGYKEIVLTGVNISRYDNNRTKFEDLIENIINIKGDFRVRISSIEPEGFTDKFIDLFDHQKLTPHLHLCLQSGSDKVLMRMRRFYTMEQYREFIYKFRSKYHDFNFTTDIIVGFPGETEDDFEESCKVAREIGFSHIHTFKYSVREGTRAARLEEHIPEKIKSERSEIIRQIAEKNKLKYRRKFIGKKQRVLVEKPHSKIGAKGYGEHFIPVAIQAKGLERNTFYDVEITDVLDNHDKTIIGKINK